MEDAGVRSGLLSTLCARLFLLTHTESHSESRFNGSEDHNDAEGRDASKVSWGFHRDDSRQCPPRSRKSRFMRASFAAPNEFPLLPLCLPDESSFLSDRKRNVGGKR